MTPCEIWEGNVNRDGYGLTSRNGVTWFTHRLAYADRHGISRERMPRLLRHTCDNRRCRNPDHLIPGTQANNMADMVARGRQCKGVDVHGSKLNEQAVLAIRAQYVKGHTLYGARALAREYGVTKRAIEQVVQRISWSHVCESK